MIGWDATPKIPLEELQNYADGEEESRLNVLEKVPLCQFNFNISVEILCGLWDIIQDSLSSNLMSRSERWNK